MIEIDGSHGEGGGQILRTAVGLAALTENEIKIANIRKSRPNPGLREQHLQGIESVAKVCGGELTGAKIGSTEVVFKPGKIKSREVNVKIRTAGSIGLLLQTLLIPAIKTNLHVKIRGGATFGKFAPPVQYTSHVLFPALEKIGYKCDLKINKHGYYPAGGADVEVWTNQANLAAFDFSDQIEIAEIKGISNSSKFLEKAQVAERQKKAAAAIIFKELGISPKIALEYADSLNPGSGIVLYCENNYVGADGLGERGKKAEDVGREAATALATEIKSGACVDKHLADQLIPYMRPGSKFKTSQITDHLRTNIFVTEQFLPIKFSIDGSTVSCSEH